MTRRIKAERKSGTKMVKQDNLRQEKPRTVNAGGVSMPVPQRRENLVKGGLIGGGAVMTTLAFTPVGPVAILVGGMAGLFVGGIIGNAVDEQRARQ